MKNFAVVICAVIAFLSANVNICNAEAIYEVSDYASKPGYRTYRAFVEDSFHQAGKDISIHLEKANVIEEKSPRDFYGYVIEISQIKKQTPFKVKSIAIMSEVDSIKIDVAKFNRNTGLNTVTDRIEYFYDPGKLNCVIKSVESKMLIRITTTNGVVYNFYPSNRYINYAKMVADWRCE